MDFNILKKKIIYNTVLKISDIVLKNFYLIDFINTIEEKKIKESYKKNYTFLNKLNTENISKTENTNIKPYKENINEYAIINMQNDFVNESYNYKNKEWIIKILKNIIKNNINYNRNITIDDCVILDVINSTGGYYPRFHTDVEWFEFNNNDCFQVWYLIKNEYNKEGNMFIYDSENQNEKYTPSKLYFSDITNFYIESNILPGSLPVFLQDILKNITDSFKDKINIGKNDKLKYLNIKQGDCFIFGKNLWHSSDWRKSFPNRKAINFRVIIKDKDGSINVNKLLDRYRCSKNSKNHTFKNNKIYNVGLFDFTNL